MPALSVVSHKSLSYDHGVPDSSMHEWVTDKELQKLASDLFGDKTSDFIASKSWLHCWQCSNELKTAKSFQFLQKVHA